MSKRLQAKIQNKGLYLESKTWTMSILHPVIQHIVENVLLENGSICAHYSYKKETWAAYKAPQTCTKKMCSHTLWSKSLFMIKETVIYALTQSGDLLVAKNGSSV